jgi:hypothetical protein
MVPLENVREEPPAVASKPPAQVVGVRTIGVAAFTNPEG